MSEHRVADLPHLADAVAARIRRPVTVEVSDEPESGEVILVFDPDLTPEEAAALATVVERIGDWYERHDGGGLDDEIAALRAFMTNATPTGADAIRALKALIRVVRAES